MPNRQMSSTLKWIAAIVIGVGVVCCILNIAQFNDRNLGLMVGIGFLVGGVQILVFGAASPLLQRRQDEHESMDTLRERA